jgi:hypothetical protein
MSYKKSPKFDFQSQFSTSKVSFIILIFVSVLVIRLVEQLIIKPFCDNFIFWSSLFAEFGPYFCQVNECPITKITSWFNFLGKNHHLVGCANVCAKIEVMLPYLFHLNVHDGYNTSFCWWWLSNFLCQSLYYLKYLPFKFCYCLTNQDTHQSVAISNPLVFSSTCRKMALKVHEISWIQTKAFEWCWLYLEIIFLLLLIIMAVSFNLTFFFSWNSLTHFQMTRMRKWWVAILLK